ncbi:creatininase family protein [Nesterenkonia sp. Act20]|uniref:creatininase family protein n=1 Tax=Nesterenkonia sp. Act20 TaxID=1483432 RepID=UPI001C4767C2|nr:creatininase family protein [Nesterenkonia sp. Act20]
MTTIEAADALSQASVALIPVGATEQHGPNLVTGVDWRIAEELASRIAERTHPLSVIVPPLPFGLSGHHQGFPGTLHISATTFMSVVKDVAMSLKRHGIEKILFINGHRGNENILGVVLSELTYDHGIEAASAFWMNQASDAIAKHRRTARWGHGCEIETSLAMALDIELVGHSLQPADLIEDYGAFEDTYAPHAVATAQSFASRTRNGVFGDATQASLEAGTEIADAAVRRISTFLEDFATRGPRSQTPASTHSTQSS